MLVSQLMLVWYSNNTFQGKDTSIQRTNAIIPSRPLDGESTVLSYCVRVTHAAQLPPLPLPPSSHSVGEDATTVGPTVVLVYQTHVLYVVTQDIDNSHTNTPMYYMRMYNPSPAPPPTLWTHLKKGQDSLQCPDD